MAKHLANTEKEKKNSVKEFVSKIRLPEIKHDPVPNNETEKVIRIPERKPARSAKGGEKPRGDAFESAFLNKTLDRSFNPSDLLLTSLALIFLVIAYFLPTKGVVRLLSFLVPFLIAGYSYLYEAFQEAFMGIVLGRELIITIAALMAFCAGSFFGGAAIMVCLKICDLVLAYVESLQGERVDSLYELKPEKTVLTACGEGSVIDASKLNAGDEIELAAGEIVPADGIVLDGTSVLDASALVGESFSFPVAAGSPAVSGCRNVNAPLRIRVEQSQADSVNSAMIRAAENSWMHKSAHERLLQRVLSYLSPALVIFAILLALIPSIATGQWRVYLLRAAILMTVSQMYSVVQSVKLSYDCAAVRAAAAGVVVKGHDVLESLSKVETFVFDKTGTVTEGEYRIKGVFPRGITEGQLLFLAGAAELSSPHPIAKAIVAASGAYATEISVTNIDEVPGRGVSAFINGSCVYVGNAAMMEEHDVSYDAPSIPGSAIHVAVDNRYVGHIVLEDAVRDCAFDVIEELRDEGVQTNVLLTGDVHSSARKIASALNFDLVKAELTPQEKCRSVEYLMSNRNVNTTLAFVGDGVCDDEALRLATVGIALGCFDRPEAVGAADAAILNRNLRTLPKLYRLAGRTSRSAIQQTFVCGAVKLLVLIFGAAGLCPLTLAVAFQTLAVLFEAFCVYRVLHSDEGKMLTRIRERKVLS